MLTNKQKGFTVEIASYLIWANRLSPIKLSETLSYIKKGFFLTESDFKKFVETFKLLRRAIDDEARMK